MKKFYTDPNPVIISFRVKLSINFKIEGYKNYTSLKLCLVRFEKNEKSNSLSYGLLSHG